MKHREKQSYTWKKISYATKPFNHLGLVILDISRGFAVIDTLAMWDYLQQPYITPEWTYITDDKTIDSLLVKWKYLHYTQANDTPLAQPSWSTPKDLASTTPEEIKKILHDTLDSEEHLSPASKALLH